MAITIQQGKRLNAVRIISRIDDAVDAEGTDWEAYDKDLDEKHIKLLPGKTPTVFLCNFELKAKEAANIKNNMQTVEVDAGENKIKMTMGSWAYQVVRLTLKDIQNPDSVPAENQLVMKREGAGYPMDETMTMLERLGVVQEIFNHYLTQTQAIKKAASKN